MTSQLRIEGLAKVRVEELAPVFGQRPEDIDLTVIGPRAGEKMWELMDGEGASHAIEAGPCVTVLPRLRGGGNRVGATRVGLLVAAGVGSAASGPVYPRLADVSLLLMQLTYRSACRRCSTPSVPDGMPGR